MRRADDNREAIDHFLSVLELGWGEDLPEVEREWAGMSPWEREDFIVDWPLMGIHQEWLERQAGERRMTVEQLARYEELKKLVAKNRPIIERLRKG